MKKILALVCTLCLLLSACAMASADTYKIGILQYVQHDALDAATQGFKDALIAELGEENLDFSNDFNASGEIGNCPINAATIVGNQVDLALGNATPALQALADATADIPVLGTAITSYEVALGIDLTEDGATGLNISGSSDLAPLDQQAAMVHELFPDAKNVGLLYCSAEANSVYQIENIAIELAALGYETKSYGFTDTNDLASVVEAAAQESDVIYIPTDNASASNTEAIANVVIPAGVPVVAGEEGICAGCGVATLTISYYELGYQTGLLGAQILKGEVNVADAPIVYAPTLTKKYNAENAAALNVTIPEGYVAIGE